ncbi:MAG: hypothetical protein OER21_05075 [Gemmatimonadota bacterium]|nr:hypothetical protein [Gemmatimonadota bacterium]
MTEPRRQPKLGLGADVRMAGALAAVLLAGFAARALATLVPPLVVGDDGAYYLVQVRAIVRDGALAVPDFPLLFYLQACVAHLLSIMMEPRAAIIAAVRITDAILPLALAVPVFLFARAFARPSDRPGQGAIAVALVGLVAVASGSSLLMAGGMIKNAVALPCGFLFAFASYEWLREGRPRTVAWAAFWFVLASLTHMGGIVLSATFGAGVLAAGLASPAVRPRVRLPAVVLLASLAACLAVVRFFDPERAQRLAHAALAPGWLFAGSPVLLWLRGISDEPLRALFTSPEVWVGNALGVLGVVILRRHRDGMDASTRVLLVASTVVTLAFSSPLLRPDVLERLALLAYVPGMIPVVYLVCREARAAVVLAPLALAVLLHGALAVKTLRQTALVPAAHEELVHFRSVLPPGRVIVIARPLLRWWVAWTMEAHFSTRVEPALAARDAYAAVLVLDEIRPGAFGVVPGPRDIGTLGAGVRDAGLLRSEALRTVAEGAYFRLSAVAIAPSQVRAPISSWPHRRARPRSAKFSGAARWWTSTRGSPPAPSAASSPIQRISSATSPRRGGEVEGRRRSR